jgi:hypothetical protein
MHNLLVNFFLRYFWNRNKTLHKVRPLENKTKHIITLQAFSLLSTYLIYIYSQMLMLHVYIFEI